MCLRSVDSRMPYKITGWIDQGLDEKAYIIPGLGDFGERRCVGRGHAGFLHLLTTNGQVLPVNEVPALVTHERISDSIEAGDLVGVG